MLFRSGPPRGFTLLQDLTCPPGNSPTRGVSHERKFLLDKSVLRGKRLGFILQDVTCLSWNFPRRGCYHERKFLLDKWLLGGKRCRRGDTCPGGISSRERNLS